MNSYQFTLKYHTPGDTRNNASYLKGWLLESGLPKASSTVKYVDCRVEFVVEGNVSAMQMVAHFESRLPRMVKKYGGDYTVTPVGNSAPLNLMFC